MIEERGIAVSATESILAVLAANLTSKPILFIVAYVFGLFGAILYTHGRTIYVGRKQKQKPV